MAVLLDTCILIDLLRKNARAAEAVMGQSERPYISSISMTELYAGVRSQREERQIEQLFFSFRTAEFGEAAFESAGQMLRHYRASHAIDFADALIAATAQQDGLELAKLNVKHFPMFKKLRPAY